MENNNEEEKKLMTSAQELLIKKIMNSSKLLDKEYRQLRIVLDEQVKTSYDASVFIEYILATFKFRGLFLNGKHKAYKKCYYCSSRDNIKRILHEPSGRKFWVCEDCYLNTDISRYVLFESEKGKESQDIVYRKYDYSPESEFVDEELKHEDQE